MLLFKIVFSTLLILNIVIIHFNTDIPVRIPCLVLLRVASKEPTRRELPILGQVPGAVRLRELVEILEIVLVALLLFLLVPLHHVVETVGVEGGVRSSAATADRSGFILV